MEMVIGFETRGPHDPASNMSKLNSITESWMAHLSSGLYRKGPAVAMLPDIWWLVFIFILFIFSRWEELSNI